MYYTVCVCVCIFLYRFLSLGIFPLVLFLVLLDFSDFASLLYFLPISTLFLSLPLSSFLLLPLTVDVQQGECLCGWTAHHGEVLNVQFSSDETSVYSLGQDNNFCQWSTLRSTEKLAHYSIHENASKPTSGWDGYFPTTPPGNLFAFESDDKYVLTCSPSGSIFYQVMIQG